MRRRRPQRSLARWRSRRWRVVLFCGGSFVPWLALALASAILSLPFFSIRLCHTAALLSSAASSHLAPSLLCTVSARLPRARRPFHYSHRARSLPNRVRNASLCFLFWASPSLLLHYSYDAYSHAEPCSILLYAQMARALAFPFAHMHIILYQQ